MAFRAFGVKGSLVRLNKIFVEGVIRSLRYSLKVL